MVHGWKLIGLFTMLGALLSLSALAVPAGLPSCIHQETTAGTLQWQCSGEELLGKLVQTLSLFAEHLTDWQFDATDLDPGSYIISIEGTIELTDPSQPASKAHFLGIEINLAPGGPS